MRNHLPLILLAASVSLASGCTGMTKNLSSAMPWGKSQIAEGKYQAPAKLVALWSPAMYNAAGKQPTRGFGGRLYFYNAKNETIPVQGQLVVYCYNDTDKTNDHKQADRRVAFTPEQFSGHFSPTQLGASYSVWVPWDAVGNPQAEISLVPIFTAATGQVVVGSQSLGLLPGPETPIQEKRVEEKVLAAKTTHEGGVTRVGFEEDITAQTLGASRIKSMSITLPQSLAERVAASRNQELRILPEPETRPKGLPQKPTTPLPDTKINGRPEEFPVKESLEEIESPNLTPAPEPLSHFERSQPRAPTLQPPRLIGGPAPLQQPQLTLPSNHP